MTREQANKVFHDALIPIGSNLVDALAAVGVLKFDEPKDAQEEFLEGLYANGVPTVPLTYHNLRQKLIDAGVKIVRK